MAGPSRYRRKIPVKAWEVSARHGTVMPQCFPSRAGLRTMGGVGHRTPTEWARPMTTDSGGPGDSPGRLVIQAVQAVAAAVLCIVVAGAPVGASARAAEAGRAGAVVPHVYGGGGVIGFGDAQPINAPIGSALNSVMVAMAVNPASTALRSGLLAGRRRRRGLRLRRRRLLRLGRGHPAQRPDRGHGRHAGRQGLLADRLDGGVFAFGDAAFYGSMGGTPLNQPVVGMAATPDGKGYWLVAADGGIFSFGDAAFYGSMGGTRLNQPITGIAATPSGHGYWMVASDGGIFTFGDARFWGSTGGRATQRSGGGDGGHAPGSGLSAGRHRRGVFGFGNVRRPAPWPAASTATHTTCLRWRPSPSPPTPTATGCSNRTAGPTGSPTLPPRRRRRPPRPSSRWPTAR